LSAEVSSACEITMTGRGAKNGRRLGTLLPGRGRGGRKTTTTQNPKDSPEGKGTERGRNVPNQVKDSNQERMKGLDKEIHALQPKGGRKKIDCITHLKKGVKGKEAACLGRRK